MLSRFLALGEVAELGKYLIVREDNVGSLEYAYSIYIRETGEKITEFSVDKKYKLVYQRNTLNKEGLVYGIGRSQIRTALAWSDDSGNKRITGIINPLLFSTFEWQDFILVLPTENEKQEIVQMIQVENGAYYLCKTSGDIIFKNDSEDEVIDKSDYIYNLDVDYGTQFAWRTTHNGIYLMSRKDSFGSESKSGRTIEMAYRVAENDGVRWSSLDEIKVVTRASEMREVYDSKSAVMKEWFDEIRFDGQ
jgi:hypothetical protein